jgi:hypothetical protein
VPRGYHKRLDFRRDGHEFHDELHAQSPQLWPRLSGDFPDEGERQDQVCRTLRVVAGHPCPILHSLIDQVAMQVVAKDFTGASVLLVDRRSSSSPEDQGLVPAGRREVPTSAFGNHRKSVTVAYPREFRSPVTWATSLLFKNPDFGASITLKYYFPQRSLWRSL